MSLHRNRVQMTVTGAPGTGTITLNAATSGYQSFSSAYGANATVDILITEGTSWEVARNCTYTNSGTTVTRGTLEASSTGSAVSFTSAAVVSVIATAGFGNAADTVLSSLGALDGENSITGTATALISRMNVCSGTSADYTVTLPAVSGNAGRYIGFSMAPGLTKLVTLDGNASETIDGETTRVMWAQETALLYCDGTTWTKIAGKTRPLRCKIQRTGSNQTVTVNSYAAATLNTFESGFQAMHDTTNGRVTIVRPGVYNATGFGYLNAGTTLGIGVARNANSNGTDENNGYSVAAVSAGNAFTNTFSCSVGDYITTWYFAFTSQATVLGTTAGSRPQLTVVEVPTW